MDKLYGISDVQVMITVKDNGQTNLSVTPDTLLTADKTMLVLGEDKALQKCFHI